MGDYTGYKWAVKVHDDLIPLAKALTSDTVELCITEINVLLCHRFDNDIYKTFRNHPRASWLLGLSNTNYYGEEWEAEYWFRDGILYACADLKNYKSTIEEFTKILPMFGDSYAMVWVFEDDVGCPERHIFFTSNPLDSDILKVIGENPMIGTTWPESVTMKFTEADDITSSSTNAWPYSAVREPSDEEIKERKETLRKVAARDTTLRNVRKATRKRKMVMKAKATRKRKIVKSSRKSNR